MAPLTRAGLALPLVLAGSASAQERRDSLRADSAVTLPAVTVRATTPITTVGGAATMNPTIAPPTIASALIVRDGRAGTVIQHATSGITSASPPLYLVAAARPAATPAIANNHARLRSCAMSDSSSVSVTKKVSGASVST